MAELTVKAVVLGIVFGVIFGAATVYLALKAGLTVSASIPIAVLAISLFKQLGKSTILENNIVQTIGSAGESIAAGVVFTLPGFLFLARDAGTGHSVGEPFFSYWTILTLAMLGGVLGVLMMIPLRRSLIVKEHGNLPYPEGTACASVLIAGEKGGTWRARRTWAWASRAVYAMLQRILHVIAEMPTLALKATQPLSAGGDRQRRDHARVPRRRLHHRPAHRRDPRRRRRARVAGADPAARGADAARRDRGPAGQARLPRRPARQRRRLGSGDAHCSRTLRRRLPRATSARSAPARSPRAASSR